jgi:hypothetical protein
MTSPASASALWLTRAARPEGRARARCPHHHPRAAAAARLGQRHRADQHDDPALLPGASNGTTSRPASRRRTLSSRASTAGSGTSCSTRSCLSRLPTPVQPWSIGRTTTRSGRTEPSAIWHLRSMPRSATRQRNGAGRCARLGGSAPRPLAPPSLTGSNDERTLLIPG